MKAIFSTLTLSLVLGTAHAARIALQKRDDQYGIDVSRYQPNVDWGSVADSGVTFAYIKATEGVSVTNPYFASQYNGAYNAGLYRGAYHFAHPDASSGADQANYFLNNGGGWSSDGATLPGALDIEYNPSGATCYGLSASDMVSWIADFSDTYADATGRYPVIYTTNDWWTTCTGNSDGFGNNPLWLARYASSIGTIPAGFGSATFWQYATSGSNPGDQDLFAGSVDDLASFASG